MKTCVHRNTLGALITERLAAIGASNIPLAARELIEADAWRACTRLVQRSITGPRVGRAVARALAGPAGTGQGCKGGTPLPSRCDAPKAQNTVAGHTHDSQSAHTSDSANGADNLPTGGSL